MYIVRILVIFVFLLFGASTFADVSPKIPTFQDQVIEAIVRASYGEPNLLDNILAKKGFPPPQDYYSFSRLVWRSFELNDAYETWPEIVKLETAYVMAEAAVSGSGNRLLQDIAQDIKQNHNIAISQEPELQSYFTELSILLQPFKQPEKYVFTILTVKEVQNARQRLDPQVQRTIDIISKYAPAFPGGTVRAMGRCCAIPEKRAFEIMRESSSIREALALAISTGTLPPELLARVSRLLLFAIDNNIAVEQELKDQHTAELDRERERIAEEKYRNKYEFWGLGAGILGSEALRNSRSSFGSKPNGSSTNNRWTENIKQTYRPTYRPPARGR